MIETEKKEERVLLIGVELQGMDNFDLSMEELASLAKTAGAVVVDSYRQKREKYDSKTFVGSGKLEEIAQMVDAEEITTVIVNNRLTLEAMKVSYKFILHNSSISCLVWLVRGLCSAVRQGELVPVVQVKVSWS